MLKVCTKCGKSLSFDKFGKETKGKYGLRSVCKECRKQYAKDNKEHIIAYKKQYYGVNKISISDKYKEYYKENSEQVKSNVKKYAIEHSTETKEYHAKYLKEHPIERIKSGQRYYIKHKEQITECHKIYVGKNKENIKQYRLKYKELNINKLREKNRLYTADHLEEKRIHCQKRRAIKHKLPSTLTIKQWEYIKIQFENKCCYCGRSLPLEQEHFIPVTHNGEYSKDNIICACRSCNSSKHDTDFFIWFRNYKYYSKDREIKILKFLHYKNNSQQLSIL